MPNTAGTLKPYKNIINEIKISDEGLVSKQNQIVLPNILWHKAFTKSQQGSHHDMNSRKRRLHSHFWFPSLNKIIAEGMKNCLECQIY